MPSAIYVEVIAKVRLVGLDKKQNIESIFHVFPDPDDHPRIAKVRGDKCGLFRDPKRVFCFGQGDIK